MRQQRTNLAAAGLVAVLVAVASVLCVTPASSLEQESLEKSARLKEAQRQFAETNGFTKHLEGARLPYVFVLQAFYDVLLAHQGAADYHSVLGLLKSLDIQPGSREHKMLNLYASRYQHEVVARRRSVPQREWRRMTRSSQELEERLIASEFAESLRALHKDFRSEGIVDEKVLRSFLENDIRFRTSTVITGRDGNDVKRQEANWRILDEIHAVPR